MHNSENYHELNFTAIVNFFFENRRIQHLNLFQLFSVRTIASGPRKLPNYFFVSKVVHCQKWVGEVHSIFLAKLFFNNFRSRDWQKATFPNWTFPSRVSGSTHDWRSIADICCKCRRCLLLLSFVVFKLEEMFRFKFYSLGAITRTAKFLSWDATIHCSTQLVLILSLVPRRRATQLDKNFIV
jgi:hypothetical protein